MASEGGSAEASSFFGSSRHRDISRLLPFILGLNADREGENQVDDSPLRIVLVNPITQGMVVIERRTAGTDGSDNGSSLGFDSFFNELFSSKSGRLPATKASIDSMRTVDVEGSEIGDQCVICLEEWVDGDKAREMPCKHRFHGKCIEKWLGIHGSCPVCRYEMPVDEGGDDQKRSGGEGDGERRRELWVGFMFGRDGRTDESRDSDSSEMDAFP
ncbi:E3 ubiquitin-protein ligase MPSR1-like [Andrographis paniculata]|uniref:E3 ubiquitin-protein ligase MPSR1-like n=1 Tax=Andrographis paniculata TaxID=175694 RepID=UPI0021E81885|nr:E3 ubiquitin-protein ligase MPSR1-like [Andrographis paniculata]XP_051122487.1 E3 ubiquitin-protein ligase MPSR1-like [Andrographis paniculata]